MIGWVRRWLNDRWRLSHGYRIIDGYWVDTWPRARRGLPPREERP